MSSTEEASAKNDVSNYKIDSQHRMAGNTKWEERYLLVMCEVTKSTLPCLFLKPVKQATEVMTVEN